MGMRLQKQIEANESLSIKALEQHIAELTCENDTALINLHKTAVERDNLRDKLESLIGAVVQCLEITSNSDENQDKNACAAEVKEVLESALWSVRVYLWRMQKGGER